MVYSLPVCPFYTLSRIIAHELGIPITIMLVFPKSSFGISKRLLTLLIVWKCCEKMQLWLPKALASSCHVTPGAQKWCLGMVEKVTEGDGRHSMFSFMAALKPKETTSGSRFQFEENSRRVETRNQVPTFRWKDTKTLKQKGQQWHKLRQSWQAVAQKTAGDVWAWHSSSEASGSTSLFDGKWSYMSSCWRIQSYKFKIILKLERLSN